MEQTNIFPVYQSIKDTIKVSGLSEFYLRKLLKAGKLPHIKSGNKVFINIPSLLKQLENGGEGY
jgi:hypothetical protein